LLNPGVATVFPFIDTAPRASRPVVVLGLIAANVLVFLWMRSLPGEGRGTHAENARPKNGHHMGGRRD
jgi:hypothetical protein